MGRHSEEWLAVLRHIENKKMGSGQLEACFGAEAYEAMDTLMCPYDPCTGCRGVGCKPPETRGVGV